MATKMKTIPTGYRIKETASGDYLVKKTRGGKKYKMSKKARNRIAASARKFKFPVLTAGALAVGTWQPLQLLIQGEGQAAGQVLLRNYTGFNIDGQGGVEFKFRYLMGGLLPLGAVMIINRSGILKPVNQKLAKAKIPLRLS